MQKARRETLETGMDPGQPLCASLLLKIQEQIDRTVHLINLVPVERPDWKPLIPDAWPIGLLLGHLLDCLAGFCAVLAAAEPKRLAHFREFRNFPVNQACSPGDAVARIAFLRARIEEGFALLDDASLGKTVPTVFVARGETLLTLFLGNLEHLINHKHQLFMDLKQMGIAVTTRDLYRFRGE
ncbi:MAG: DinB family protein [Bryobacteraceae bacterium]